MYLWIEQYYLIRVIYSICSVIRQGFAYSKIAHICVSVTCNSVIILFGQKNNLKNLDSSYKMDLDL